MTAIVSHSPLERFLLFDTIYSHDDTSPSFNALSESLKNHEALREQENGDITRLDPEALKALYLGVIREGTQESGLKVDEHNVTQENQEEADPRTPTPPISESIEQASHQKHLLPDLLHRLYFQYRDHAIKEIEEDERQYRTLKDEIEEIHRKKRDGQIQEQPPARRNSRGISSIQHLLQHDPAEDKAAPREASPPIKSPQLHLDQVQPSENIIEDQSGLSLPNETAIPSTLPPPPATTTSTPESRPQSSVSLQESPPFYAAPQQSTQAYPITSPKSDISHRPTLPSHQMRPNLAPSPSTRLSQGPLPTPDRGPSNSPIILPPPRGMPHPGSPPGPLETLADMAGQQYRGRQPLPPRSAQVPAGQHVPPYHPYSSRPYGYYEGHPSYSSAYSPYSQNSGSPYTNPNPPSYSPYGPTATNPVPHAQHANATYQSYPQYSPYGHAPHYPHTPRHTALGPPAYPASAQQTPVTGSNGPGPLKPSPIITSTSSFKSTPLPSSIKTGPRPGPDEISPISDHAPSLPPSPTIAKKLPSSPAAGKRVKNPRRTAAKANPARQGSTASRRGGRRGSTTSRRSTRSQSASSPVVNESDKFARASQRMVKNEPPATPAADTADETASVISTTADETTGTRKSARHRRDTMRGIEAVEALRPSTATKRKRGNTEGTSAEPPTSTPAVQSSTSEPKPLEGQVTGARNFPRTSATIMSQITSHRLAGMFAKPLTAKEAPGYNDLIYRPQDLKSIKGAITAGNRALVAADSSGENNVTLPTTADVVPPKGIVNAAQLEKELMRMFANAVMFNPDPKRGVGPSFGGKEARHVPRRLEDEEADELGENEDEGKRKERGEEGGVVGDTREVYEAVERSVENWRVAEDWGGLSGTPARGAGAKAGGVRMRGGEETEADEAADEATPEAPAASPVVAMGRRRRR